MSAPAESLPEIPADPQSVEPTPVVPARSHVKRNVIIVIGVILLAGVAGGAWLLAGSARKSSGRASLLVADDAPLPPPPAVEFSLASPPAEAASDADPKSPNYGDRLRRITALATAMSANAKPVSDGLIVLPGRQAKAQAETEIRHERWEIRLPPDVTLESYARQLDYFGIELGVIGGKKEVVYLSRLSDPQPKQRSGSANREGRLYMTWQRGGLAEADRKLASRAKIDTQGKIIAMFCPTRIEKDLAELERTEAKRKKIDVVLKTSFGILPEGKGFRFYVIEMQAGEKREGP